MKNALEKKVLDAVSRKGLVDMIYDSIREPKKFSGIVIDYFLSLLALCSIGFFLLALAVGDYFINSDPLGHRLYLDGGAFAAGILVLLVRFFIKMKMNREIRRLPNTDWSLFLFGRADELLKKHTNNAKADFQDFFQFGAKLTDLIQLADSFPILDRYEQRIRETTNEFLRIFKSLGEDPFSSLKQLEPKEMEKIISNLFWKWSRYEKEILEADFLVEKARNALHTLYKKQMENPLQKEEDRKQYERKIESLTD
jgi:hypothetical protein